MAAKNLGADGEVWLSRKDAAVYCGVSVSSIRAAEKRNELRVRVERGGVRLVSRRALDDWRSRVGRAPEPMREAAALVDAGASPAVLVTELGFTPERARSFVESMRFLRSCWIVEGPNGSRDAWLRAYGLESISPLELRRALELLSLLPAMRARLRGEPAYEPLRAFIARAHVEHERGAQLAAVLRSSGWSDVRTHHRLGSFADALQQARTSELIVILQPLERARRASLLWSLLGAMAERAQWSEQQVIVVAERSPLPPMPRTVHVVRSLAELAPLVARERKIAS